MNTQSVQKSPSDAWQSLPDAISFYATTKGEKVAYIYSPPRSGTEQSITYAELHASCAALARVLLDRYALAGKRVLLLFPPGLDFIRAMFGCMYANVSVIPMYAPTRDVPDNRLRAIVSSVEVAAILTVAAKEQAIRKIVNDLGLRGECEIICTDLIRAAGTAVARVRTNHDVPALIQFTSGSTSKPKGVIVTHNNIMANQRMIQAAFEHVGGETVVSWLPFFHDMGLIGNIMQPVFIGGCSILMSPADFLQNPLKWLHLISRYSADTSGAPNFAYDYCVSRISDEEAEALDLSSWKLAYNGSEMIRTPTMQRFARKFAKCGFRASGVLYCYGLAEATLYVSSKKAFQCAYEALGSDINSLASVGGGNGLSEVCIVDEQGHALPDGETGEIWVRGPHVALGYINDIEATRKTFQARVAGDPGEPFMRTGDLGYRQNGELFIVGRLKNVIVVNGRNYYGEEIEHFVAQSDGYFSESGACIIQMNEGLQDNRIIFLQEIKKDSYEQAKQDLSHLETRANELKRQVLDRFNLPVHRMIYLRENRLPRTSSGKIDRASTRSVVGSGDIACLLDVHTS